jgi:hypothetical protein
MPTDYEIGTTKLHYYVGRGFEIDVPLGAWFRAHQVESPLVMPAALAWDEFVDPRQTTYASYVALQKDKEAHLEAVHRAIDERGSDRSMDAGWLARLERVWAPFRFAGHGLQMLAAYVGQLAPSGRITVACAFQAADEMRRVQWIAYRIAQLRAIERTFAEGARGVWERDEAWQPMRRLIERMLVTYDWGEALVALNLCAKPIIDHFFLVELGEIAHRYGDGSLRDVTFSLAEDARWHRAWSGALARLAIAARPPNEAVLRGWVEKWLPSVDEAVRALGDAVDATTAGEAASAEGRVWLRGLEVLS